VSWGRVPSPSSCTIRRRRHSNFGFSHTDVYNGVYNAEGPIPPEEVTLPYGDDQFDVAFLFV